MLRTVCMAALFAGAVAGCHPAENKEWQTTRVDHLNPEGLIRNPAFTQAIAVSGLHKTIYVGGQNGVDASGRIVGQGDLAAQTEQAFMNLQTALAAGGARLEDVVQWNIYIVAGQPAYVGFQVFQRIWGQRPNPPTISVIHVAALARPEFLVEISAIAIVAQDGT